MNEYNIEFKIICFVLKHGQASKALKIAREHGVKGGTICYGHGTSKSFIPEWMELSDLRKELLWTVTGKHTAAAAVYAVAEAMGFSKPHRGIAFILPIDGVAGMTIRNTNHKIEMNETAEAMYMGNQYQAIFTVVEKGGGEDVVEAAKAAGAGGATIINARGAGQHETDTLFAMPIEPEKEMVLILADSANAEAIVKSISERLKLDEPGKGILFTSPVNAAVGLHK